MTYLQFHFVFILPAIALLALALRGRAARLPRRAWPSLAAMVAIAFVYTTPWDNYLVWRGVWGYGSERVIGTIGYVPIEEYMFFGLQPVLTGLFLYNLIARRAGAESPASVAIARWAGALAWLAVAIAGALMLRVTEWVYMGLILAWAAPVLAGQWAFAGAEIWARRRLLLVGVGVPTLYLWFADWVAIRLGIWEISATYTTGFGIDTLPIEEATFFLITNLLVVKGLILFVYPPNAADRPAAAAPRRRGLDRSGAR